MIILDAGHGKNTPGKRSPIYGDGSQLFEWEFNRDIVNQIADKLSVLNIKYHILVPGSFDMPLEDRVKNANMFGVNNLYISVHANAGRGKGVEIFTSKGETLSDKIATIFIKEFINEFPLERVRSDYADGDSDKEENFYVLKNTVMPAILTENFFMDNERECREFLMDAAMRDRISDYHVYGIMETLKKYPELK